jgi:hypothetical protein
MTEIQIPVVSIEHILQFLLLDPRQVFYFSEIPSREP